MNDAEKFWDEKAVNFDENAKSFANTSIKMIELTKKYINIHDSVLDFGCATGAAINELADKVHAITGIDISSKMIEIAKKNVGSGNSNNITFRHATLFDDSLQKEKFTVVLAFNMLHLFEDPPQVVQQIKKLLKPEGLFISATRIMNNKMTRPNIFPGSKYKSEVIPKIQLLEFTTLENLITSTGFEIIETKDLQGMPTCYFIVAKRIN